MTRLCRLLNWRNGLACPPSLVKKVQRLEKSGVITGRVAQVDHGNVGLGLTVLVEVSAMEHSAAWRDRFLAAVQSPRK